MTLHIELSPQTESKLRERAAASGKDVGSYALDAIEQKLAADQGNGAVPTSPRQGGEEWFARFSEWVAAHPPPSAARRRQPRCDLRGRAGLLDVLLDTNVLTRSVESGHQTATDSPPTATAPRAPRRPPCTARPSTGRT